jgi:DNA ligase D-like protein (predicted ligase)
MPDVLDRLPDEVRDRLEQEDPPSEPRPMLATLTDRRFSDLDWIYERKLDGERCLAVRQSSSIRLVSRNGQELNDTYPDIAEGLAGAPADRWIVDGEIVAFHGNVTSFSRLQQRMQLEDPDAARESRIRVYYYVFDLLHLDGYDTSGIGLRHRKTLLKHTLDLSDPIRYLPHRNEEGEAYFREACRKGWEGVIAKRADSTYVHSRSRDWLKFKCVEQQEFVIGGFTDPKGERKGFGALLVGYYDDGDLAYAGKVGTGYDDATLERLASRLHALERKTAPFVADDLPTGAVHWVTPNLVAEVGFTEWTSEGKLRHPRFVGLRRDKNPESVVRERPAD